MVPVIPASVPTVDATPYMAAKPCAPVSCGWAIVERRLQTALPEH